MNLCEIQKTIESIIDDINSIKGNTSGSGSNTGCDCPYQVIIKGTPGDNVSYEVVKGDYATAISKIENGEYVDFVAYSLTYKGTRKDIQTFQCFVSEYPDCISIVVDPNSEDSVRLFWTADGISTNSPDNPGGIK